MKASVFFLQVAVTVSVSFLNVVRDSIVRIVLGISFHQQETVNESMILCLFVIVPLTHQPQAPGGHVDS